MHECYYNEGSAGKKSEVDSRSGFSIVGRNPRAPPPPPQIIIFLKNPPIQTDSPHGAPPSLKNEPPPPPHLKNEPRSIEQTFLPCRISTIDNNLKPS